MKKTYEPIPVLAAEIVLAAPYMITDSVTVKIAAFSDIFGIARLPEIIFYEILACRRAAKQLGNRICP